MRVILKKRPTLIVEIVTIDLDSPRQHFFVNDLGLVVALLVHWQISFVCTSTGDPIQLYCNNSNRAFTWIGHIVFIFVATSVMLLNTMYRSFTQMFFHA